MGIVAVILGILAIAAALFATMMFGSTGIIIAAVLAVAAIVLGVLKRRKDKKGGIAGIVIAVIAVILAISLANVWNMMFTELHKKALELQPDGLWAQVSEDTSHGVMGILKNLPTDEASLEQLTKEANELNNAVSKPAE